MNDEKNESTNKSNPGSKNDRFDTPVKTDKPTPIVDPGVHAAPGTDGNQYKPYNPNDKKIVGDDKV